MQFFKTAGSSIYDPGFYKSELGRKPLSFSFKYLAGLVLISSAVIAIPVIGAFFSLSRVAKDAAAAYPPALIFTIKAGVVSTNAKEPYFIAYKTPPQNPADGRKNFIAIDTSAPESISAFRAEDATILIGKNFVISEGQGGKISVDQIPSTMNVSLSKDSIDSLSAKLHPFLPLIAIAWTLFFYALIAAASYVGALASALVLACIVFFIERVRKEDISFRDSYRFAIHALTLPILLSALFLHGSFYFVLLGLVIYLANRYLPARNA